MLESEIASFRDEQQAKAAAETARNVDLAEKARAMQEPIDRAWAEAATPIRVLAKELAQALLSAGVSPTDTVPHLPSPPRKERAPYLLPDMVTGIRDRRKINKAAAAEYQKTYERISQEQFDVWVLAQRAEAVPDGYRISRHDTTRYISLSTSGELVTYTIGLSTPSTIVDSDYQTMPVDAIGAPHVIREVRKGGVKVDIVYSEDRQEIVINPGLAAQHSLEPVKQLLLEFALANGIGT